MSLETLIFFSVGNPGPATRHSTGHIMLRYLQDYFDLRELTKKAQYSITKTSNNGIILVKSNSYMNESNKALKQFLDGERIKLNESSVLVILYDDFENNLGKVKISTFKKNESHNGIKSIQNLISSKYNTATVYKLGIGIGPKPHKASKDTMSSWVLSKFNAEEAKVLEDTSFDLLTDYMDEIIERDGEIGDCNKFNAHMTKITSP
ncbi:peptidyl-tRNA hydrolase [Scheffersomyces xylosifermentans]|uniref:peptidyl-tRNA hydrolase n=1 Tax=Scheffersomyces xylosifermentans TaxID=1304137 RepID=UPI00315D377D